MSVGEGVGLEGAGSVHVYAQMWMWRDVQKFEWKNAFLETFLALK
jgi:hypothetical protein